MECIDRTQLTRRPASLPCPVILVIGLSALGRPAARRAELS